MLLPLLLLLLLLLLRLLVHEQSVYLVYCGFRLGRRIIDEFRRSMRSR